MEVPAEAFTEILDELERQPIGWNHYRMVSGLGRSQTFGVVGRRGLPPDYSRQNWRRPYLFKLLTDFGDHYVDISYNSISVNQNYRAAPHYDKGNIGEAFLVAFGNYTGGQLQLHEGGAAPQEVDVCHKPVIRDFSQVLHSVKEFEGNRCSLVFYWMDLRGVELPPWEVKKIGSKWNFFRGDVMIDRKKGLPHPLRKDQG